MHPRAKIVSKWKIDLQKRITDWFRNCDEELTDAEAMKILTEELSNNIQGMLKYTIRFERHGDYDKPADKI